MGNNPSFFKGDDLPVESISWFDCQKFCDKSATLGLPVQLPTEAQWEYACRAGKTTKFFWGNSLSPDKANFGEQVNKTTPVRSYAPNAWGLYDMHGNVWEWCQDWRADYPSEHVTDPTGPSSGSRRIDRGGCWKSSEKYCRSGYRDDSDPKERFKSVGFRCVIGQNN